jgi:hypothetical protein
LTVPSKPEPSKQFGVPVEVGAGKSDVVVDEAVEEGGFSPEILVLDVWDSENEVVPATIKEVVVGLVVELMRLGTVVDVLSEPLCRKTTS